MNFVKHLTIKSMLRLLVCLPVLFLIAILLINSAESYTNLRQAASLKKLATIAALQDFLAHSKADKADPALREKLQARWPESEKKDERIGGRRDYRLGAGRRLIQPGLYS